MKTTTHVKYHFMGIDIQPTGAWRYYPDLDNMEIEISYDLPNMALSSKITTWLIETQVHFFYENHPDAEEES